MAGKTNVGLDAWKAKTAARSITLPSGFVVSVVIPDVATMLAGGDMPNPLREVALRELSGQTPGKITEKALKDTLDFAAYVVTRMVVEPEITMDDLPELPVGDRDVLVALGKRDMTVDEYEAMQSALAAKIAALSAVGRGE